MLLPNLPRLLARLLPMRNALIPKVQWQEDVLAAWGEGVTYSADLLEKRAAVATSEAARNEALAAAATLRLLKDCGPLNRP